MPTAKQSNSSARKTPVERQRQRISERNLSSPRVMRSVSARQLRQSFRKRQFTRTHQQLHEASDWLRHDIDVEASGFARIWIGVGIRIAAELLEELAAEMLVEDIVNETK